MSEMSVLVSGVCVWVMFLGFFTEKKPEFLACEGVCVVEEADLADLVCKCFPAMTEEGLWLWGGLLKTISKYLQMLGLNVEGV